MSSQPLVSIITPCYNSEKYIGRYLSKILLQSYDNIELVIINDGSIDNTERIINQFAEKIRGRGYLLNYTFQNNAGLGAAIETGLKKMSGEYFCWCDSDNFYDNEYVMKNIDCFSANPAVSVVRCDGFVVNEASLDKTEYLMSNGEYDKHNPQIFMRCLLVENFHFGCAMIKTISFDSINPQRSIYKSREGQNWQILLPMLYFFKTAYIDEPLFYFVYRDDSISNISKTQHYSKLIDQYDEYCEIVRNTLNQYEFEEKEKYYILFKNKFERMKLKIYFDHNDYKGFCTSYKWIKRNDNVSVVENIKLIIKIAICFKEYLKEKATNIQRN